MALLNQLLANCTGVKSEMSTLKTAIEAFEAIEEGNYSKSDYDTLDAAIIQFQKSCLGTFVTARNNCIQLSGMTYS